jgi:hypothetical protein
VEFSPHERPVGLFLFLTEKKMAEQTSGTDVASYTMTGTSPKADTVPAVTDKSKIEKAINPTGEKELLALIIRRFDEAVGFSINIHSKFDEIYKLYRGYIEDKDKVWKSNLFVPTAFTVIETLLPQILAVLFGPKFVVKIVPREKMDIVMSGILQQLIRYQFERMKVFRKFYIWIKSCLMYGVGVMKVYWRYESKKRKINQPVYLHLPLVGKVKIGSKDVEKVVTSYDDPDCEPIDIYDFYVPVNCTNLRDAKWCIQKVFRSIDYLIAQEKNGFYKNISSVSPGLPENSGPEKDVRMIVNTTSSDVSMDKDNLVELLEYWTDDQVVVVANRTTIIRNEPNPFWHGRKPYLLIKDIEMPHEFYALGEIEPIKSLIYERNEIRNQRLDNVKNIVNRKLVVDRNSDIDLDHIDEDNKPGGIILTDNVNSIKYLEEIDIVASAYNEDQMVVRDIQEATGMAETTIGVMPRRGETATAVNALRSAAASRFTLKTQLVISEGVVDFIDMLIQLDIQFLNKKRLVRIIGKDGEKYEEISASDITGNYDYEIQAGLFEINKDAERQQWLMLAASPLFQKPNVNFEEMQKDTLKRFDVTDPERFVTPMNDSMRMAMAGAGPGDMEKQPAGVGSIAGVAGTPPARP